MPHNMWDFLQPGIKLMSPALEVHSLNHWTTREVQMLYILDLKEKSLQSPLAVTPDFVVKVVIFQGTLRLMKYTIKINFTTFLKKTLFLK